MTPLLCHYDERHVGGCTPRPGSAAGRVYRGPSWVRRPWGARGHAVRAAPGAHRAPTAVILAHDDAGVLENVAAAKVVGESFVSMTEACPEVHFGARSPRIGRSLRKGIRG